MLENVKYILMNNIINNKNKLIVSIFYLYLLDKILASDSLIISMSYAFLILASILIIKLIEVVSVSKFPYYKTINLNFRYLVNEYSTMRFN